MRFGYVGIGNMGGPMAANLARGGNEVIIGDLNKAAVDTFTAEHETARPANGMAAVGQDADAVFTCLPNGKIVRDAILGDGGVAEGMAALETVRRSALSTAANAARLAGGRLSFLSAGSTPLSSAEARAAQPASAIWV